MWLKNPFERTRQSLLWAAEGGRRTSAFRVAARPQAHVFGTKPPPFPAVTVRLQRASVLAGLQGVSPGPRPKGERNRLPVRQAREATADRIRALALPHRPVFQQSCKIVPMGMPQGLILSRALSRWFCFLLNNPIKKANSPFDQLQGVPNCVCLALSFLLPCHCFPFGNVRGTRRSPLCP